MTTFNARRLMALLPAVHRLRDAEREGADPQRGGPLAAFLAVLAEEIAVVEENISQLYDDQFIETCADWVVPYIGDLVGHRTLPLSAAAARFATPRAEVANAITYRRRKGTAAILEQVARDVTGWPAHLIEYFQQLAASQHLNYPRPRIALPDVSQMARVERIGSPFDEAPRSLEVRRLATGRGRFNIPNVGVTLWRLGTYDIEAAMPRPDNSAPDSRFRFSPLGLDAPLFNPTQVESDALGFATDVNLPDPLPRRALARELNERRAALVNGDDVIRRFFADDAPFAIAVAGTRIPDDQVLICDLSAWTAAPGMRAYRRRSDGAMVPRVIGVAVDPVLGRFAFPSAVDPDEVRVSHSYGFAADLGGGPYDRSGSVTSWVDPVGRPVTWQIGVTRDATALASSNPPHSRIVDSVIAAVGAWKLHVAANPGAFGVIAIMDSATYRGALTGPDRVDVPAGARLAIVAAGWPRRDDAGPGGPFRPLGGLTADGLRPHIQGDVSVCGTTAPDEVLSDGTHRPRMPGALILDGLLIEGDLRVLVGDLGRLEVRHTTLLPAAGGITVHGSVQPALQNPTLVVTLEHSVAGPVTFPDKVPALTVLHSIVNGAVTAPDAHLEVVTSTVTGTALARQLDASDAIFVAPVTITRRQTGCVRFSHVPEGSGTPRRFHCQPDLAVSQLSDAALASETRRRVSPVFTSLRYGDPGYGQLAHRCAIEIRTGASDGAEMGAFNLVKQPQREANLRLRMREHLRVGLEAGFFYRT